MRSHLSNLEDEAIYILREVFFQFKKPALLFSGGKDSCVLLHLAKKIFPDGQAPFPLLVIDTGHNFPEVNEFIRRSAENSKLEVFWISLSEMIKAGELVDTSGPFSSRNRLQSQAVMKAVRDFKFDALIGGGRRDEEKSRAKERIFSVRDSFGVWNPREQRAEPWGILNGHLKPSYHMRVFPLSNWTELDIWEYIGQQQVEISSLYFAHERECVRYEGVLYPSGPYLRAPGDLGAKRLKVRFRTVGDMNCSSPMESSASCVEDILQEIKGSAISERGLRLDDRFSETAMEDRKREGYF